MEERLQKILAAAGFASRRRAEKMIMAGLVKVNGRVVDRPGTKADPETDLIEVDGKPLRLPEETVYFIFYKPVGFITTLNDPAGRPTIAPFLANLGARVYPVGRLDNDVEGLLVLTNDGELAARLMHPRHHVPKTYRVKVKGLPSRDAIRLLASGTILLGDRPAAPAEVELIKSDQDRAWLHITVIEGRHHQIKRMCSQAGLPVLKLKRISFGPLTLGRLEPGAIRRLKPSEVRELKSAAGLLKKG
ncbi:MAG: pseudouridine synthase [Pseudomonadota bacterium]